MASTIECNGVPTGLTLTASFFADGSDTATQTGVSATEATNRKTTYSFSANTTGLHLIHLKSGSNVVWTGWAILATSGTIIASDSREGAGGITLTSAYDFAKGTVAPTESYRSANGVPTPIQALLELIAHMGESSISSTTKTLKKVDGSTTAKTFTLNDATTPTSIAEAT